MDQETPDNMGAGTFQGGGQAMPDKSPIRPQNPNPPKPKINPALARPSKPETPFSTAEFAAIVAGEADPSLMDKSEQALEHLRQKMADVAQEYSEGKINQAQFNAIYRRYTEQREITERLIARNPSSEAWQSVVQPGQTSFLRDYFAAKIVSYGIYRLEDGWQITLQGTVRLPQPQLLPVVARVKRLVGQGHQLGLAWRQLKDGNWVAIVPGKWTLAVVIFSLEPAGVQRKKVEDAQRDFERANEKILQRDEFDPETLVYPHRALIQD